MSNQEIIEDYYRSHRSELVDYVRCRLHQSEEAEDLVQEAFLRILRGSRPICEETIGSLSYTLCNHLVIDWYRRHAIRNNAERELAHRHSLGESAESVLSIRDITEQMEHSLARLPEDCRTSYRMHIYGGLKAKDICLATGQKYKAVEYLLGLARKQVRTYLRHIS